MSPPATQPSDSPCAKIAPMALIEIPDQEPWEVPTWALRLVVERATTLLEREYERSRLLQGLVFERLSFLLMDHGEATSLANALGRSANVLASELRTRAGKPSEDPWDGELAVTLQAMEDRLSAFARAPQAKEGTGATRRGVSVYERADLILVQRHFSRPGQMGLSSSRPSSLPSSATDEVLGAAIRASLDLREDDEPPASDRYGDPALQRLAGVRSWRAFAKAARLADVAEDRGRFEIGSSDRRPSGAFMFRREDRPTLDGPTDAVLGAAVRVALSRSTP